MRIISVPSIFYSCCETKICARWPALILIGFQTRQKMMSWQKYHYYITIIITIIGSAGTKNKKKLLYKSYTAVCRVHIVYMYILLDVL